MWSYRWAFEQQNSDSAVKRSWAAAGPDLTIWTSSPGDRRKRKEIKVCLVVQRTVLVLFLWEELKFCWPTEPSAEPGSSLSWFLLLRFLFRVEGFYSVLKVFRSHVGFLVAGFCCSGSVLVHLSERAERTVIVYSFISLWLNTICPGAGWWRRMMMGPETLVRELVRPICPWCLAMQTQLSLSLFVAERTLNTQNTLYFIKTSIIKLIN